MKKVLLTAIVLAATAMTLSACVVAGPGHPGCPWVAGHYGPGGAWHPGHCA